MSPVIKNSFTRVVRQFNIRQLLCVSGYYRALVPTRGAVTLMQNPALTVISSLTQGDESYLQSFGPTLFQKAHEVAATEGTVLFVFRDVCNTKFPVWNGNICLDCLTFGDGVWAQNYTSPVGSELWLHTDCTNHHRVSDLRFVSKGQIRCQIPSIF